MTDPVEQIAEKLIASAYRHFGNPGEAAGGDYIAIVTKDTDVPAHFRRIAKLAAAPRSMDLHEQYREATAHYDADRDADMVMHAGLDHLLKDTALPAEQRRVIEQIKALDAWAIDVTHEENRKAEEAIVEQLRREGKWSE